jgi:chemotaxis protein MotB
MKPRASVPNPHAARASGDRWLFGYADIVTLLLAVFASLYATGQVSSAEPPPAPVIATPVAAPVAPLEVPTPPPAAVESADVPAAAPALALAFADVVGDAVSLPGVEMTTSTRGLVISLPEAGSFPAGRADLSIAVMTVMAELAARLHDLPNLVRVEGHTDDVPIATTQFASNWDLSTARATRVVEFLIEEGIDPGRLAAAGYAEYRPRRPNDSPGSRARNRRVDIVVLDPVAATREEPGAIAP